MRHFLSYQGKSALILIFIIFCDQHAFGQKIPDFQFRVLHESGHGESWADEISRGMVETLKESRQLRALEKPTPEKRFLCCIAGAGLATGLALYFGPSVLNRMKDYTGRVFHWLKIDKLWYNFWGHLLCGGSASGENGSSATGAQSSALLGGGSASGTAANVVDSSGPVEGGSSGTGAGSISEHETGATSGSVGSPNGGELSSLWSSGSAGQGGGLSSLWGGSGQHGEEASETSGDAGQSGGLWMIHHTEENGGGSASNNHAGGEAGSSSAGSSSLLGGGSSGSTGSMDGTTEVTASGGSANGGDGHGTAETSAGSTGHSSGGWFSGLWSHGSTESHQGFMSELCQKWSTNGGSDANCNEDGKQKLGVPCR